MCVEGFHKAYKYCDENNIPYKECGKVSDLYINGETNSFIILKENLEWKANLTLTGMESRK